MGGRRAFRKLTGALPETARVEDMNTDGQGIASIGGKRIFVAGAIRGESVELRRVRSHRSYDEAELVGVVEPSPDRVEPRCRYFGTCGACSLQHLAPEGQVRLKESVLLESLGRIGRVAPGRVMPAVTGSTWGYRRRARLAARYVEGKSRVLVGFSERDSSRITDMASCETLHPTVSALIAPLGQLIASLSVARRLPQVEVAVADNATALVFRVLDAPSDADLAALRDFGVRHSVRILLQAAREPTPLDGHVDGGEFWYDLPSQGLRMTFGPTDFIQVNAAVNERMIDLALGLLEPHERMRILDLYCGIGNFTLPLARRAGHVLGIEGETHMVERARRNAEANGIGNVAFRASDLARPGALDGAGRFDAVLLDPPRAGAAQLMAPIAASGARRVLYVSCHPGTLARDAGTLVNELGYGLVAAGILDMFPCTSHVESVALFERAG
jgi:23S rRNA (uracil1939-C5)-methyltransferase